MQSSTIHLQSNITLNTTLLNNKAKLIFTRIVHSQNKINIITTVNNQANSNDNNFSTISFTAFIQENSQDVSSHMSMNKLEIECIEFFSVIISSDISL